MPHLERERLAAFDHDPFSDEERAHLRACAACRRELEAMNQLVARAAVVTSASVSSAPVGTLPSLTSFDAIMEAMRADASMHAHPREVRVSWGARARRVAAALVLVTGGAVLGRVTGGSGVTDATRAGLGAAMARLDEAPMSIASATALLDRAQQDYQRAALWLAANDSVSQSSEVYRARLAALDDMMAASRAALREAPQDPLLNHYFLSAWAAREATLQQLGAALPVDKLVERY